MGQQSIIWSLAIIASLFLLLLFIRSAFNRKARDSNAPTLIVAGGGWNDGGIGGIGRYRPVVVVRPPRAALREDVMGAQSVDELPRYEGPPPEYKAVEREERGEAAGEGRVGGLGGPPPVRVEQLQEEGGRAGGGWRGWVRGRFAR